MKKLIFIVLILGVGLAGCGNSSKEIVFWNALTASDGDYMTDLVDAFNEGYEGEYHIEQSIIPNEDLYTKLSVAKGDKENLPDIVLMDNTRIPQFVEAGILMPMDDIATEIGISRDKYIPGAWETASYNDTLYGIPFDTFIHVLYYNEDILDKLGYTKDDIWNMTNEKAIQIAQEAIDAGYNGWGMFQDWPWQEIFMGYLYQAGGEFTKPDDVDQVNINTEAGKKALEGFYAPYAAGVTNDPEIDGSIEFMAGNTLFKYDGIWQTKDYVLENEEANVGIVPLPTLENGNQKMYAGSHNITIIDKEYDEEQKECIEAFALYLNENSGQFSQAGQIPANMDTWDSEEFKGMPFYDVAKDNYKDIIYAQQTIYFGTMFAEVGTMCTSLINGVYPDVETALEQTQKDIEEQVIQMKQEG